MNTEESREFIRNILRETGHATLLDGIVADNLSNMLHLPIEAMLSLLSLNRALIALHSHIVIHPTVPLSVELLGCEGHYEELSLKLVKTMNVLLGNK